MISRESLRKRYQKLQEHFDSSDLLGLSALIFGLILSSSGAQNQDVKLETPTPTERESPSKATRREKKVQNKQKKRHSTTAALSH